MELRSRKSELRDELYRFILRRGFRFLRRGKHETALGIGRWLIKRRFSGGFELTARSLWALGRQTEAAACLDAGVRKFPSIYLLWSYLGEYRSSMGQFELAIEAFEHARTSLHPGVAEYNIGLVHARAGRPAEAVPYLEGIELDRENWLTVWARQTLAQAYDELGEHELSRRAWREVCEFSYPLVKGTDGETDIARSFGKWAMMEHKLGDPVEARRILGLAQQFHIFNLDVLQATRVLGGIANLDSYKFEVEIEGFSDGVTLKWAKGPVAYSTSVFVAASIEDQLLPYIVEIEALAGCSEVQIVSIVQSNLTDEEWQGVLYYGESRRKI